MPLADAPLLHVGDRLRLVCPEMPELCVDRVVGPDGTIDLPILGALPAVARSLDELRERILESLPASGHLPRLELRRLGSASGTVSVLGAVAQSLFVFAPRGIDRDRLLKAAGPRPDADLALLPSPGRLPGGTTLEVPSVTADRRVSVLGEVASPISLNPAPGLTLGAAVTAAGGLNAHANPGRLLVVRLGESIPVALPDDAAFPLQPGDVVRADPVADRRYVQVRGLVARPGSVEYASGMTALRALAAAGGPLAKAASGTLVWQTGSKTFRLSLTFLLARRIPDPPIGANDSLTLEAGKP